MGSILQTSCPCGYQSEGIFSGSGMMPDPAPALPGLCLHCKEIVTVKTGKRKLRCPKCGQRPKLVKLYDPNGLDERFDGSCPSP
jgi:hypothetical protein